MKKLKLSSSQIDERNDYRKAEEAVRESYLAPEDVSTSIPTHTLGESHGQIIARRSLYPAIGSQLPVGLIKRSLLNFLSQKKRDYSFFGSSSTSDGSLVPLSFWNSPSFLYSRLLCFYLRHYIDNPAESGIKLYLLQFHFSQPC